MIIDTAVHYVQPATADRPYDEAGNQATKILLVEDAVRRAVDAGIDRIVQMAPSILGFDNRYSLEGAARYPDRVLGVFGRCDPMAPNLRERLAAFASQPGILGIRVLFLRGTPSEHWLRDRALDPFFRIAQEAKIAVSCYPADARVFRETARRFPGLRFIAEHMTLSKPKDGADSFASWPAVLKLAAEPNVWTQVSFFPEAVRGIEGFPFPTGQRRFKELYESAGPSRLVWGAHYPRIEDVCTYRQALEFVRTECEFLKEPDTSAILGDNFVAGFARKDA